MNIFLNVDTVRITGERASRPCDIRDANGVAIISNQSGVDVEYQPFRHPSLLDNEIRIKVTNTGLCMTDIAFMKNSWE